MSDDQKVETEPAAKSRKKDYDPPSLKEYGKVVEMTRGDGSNLAIEVLGISI